MSFKSSEGAQHTDSRSAATGLRTAYLVEVATDVWEASYTAEDTGARWVEVATGVYEIQAAPASGAVLGKMKRRADDIYIHH